jgi:hypothetical protein
MKELFDDKGLAVRNTEFLIKTENNFILMNLE